MKIQETLSDLIRNLLGGQYFINKNIRFKTSVLKSDLCNHKYPYIVLKGKIALGVDENNNMT